MNAAITNPVNLIIIILGAFLGITLGIFLLFNKSAKNRANFYLGLLILFITLYFATGAFFRFDLLEKFPHIIGLQQVSGFIIGPMGYFYVRACTQKGFELKPILLLHFLPFVIDVLINAPFFMEDGATKIAYYQDFVQSGNLKQNSLVLILKSLSGIVYFSLAVNLILKYRNNLPNIASHIDETFHRWLLIFIIILGLPMIGLMGFVFTDFQRGVMMLSALGLFSLIIVVYMAVIIKPEYFMLFHIRCLFPNLLRRKSRNTKAQNCKKRKKKNISKNCKLI